MLFLQAAGSDFGSAHDLVAAVTEILRAPHDEPTLVESLLVNPHHSGMSNGPGARRAALKPERLAVRLERAHYDKSESLILALAVLATTASSLTDEDVDWISSVADRVEDEDLLLESAGVMFAFNTINRIADARRVRLEFRFLRQLKPIRGWVERRLASVTALAYDLTVKYRASHSSTKLLDRAGDLFTRLGAPVVPEVCNWLSRSPVVLEGVLEMIDSNVTNSQVRSDLLKEAIAIGVASRAMPGSDLRRMADQWLPPEALCDSKALRSWATRVSVGTTADLVLACRRYAWQVANAAYTITDEQISELTALGLSDAELLDLTLATSAFSALAIIEPLSTAVPQDSGTAGKAPKSKQSRGVRAQLV